MKKRFFSLLLVLLLLACGCAKQPAPAQTEAPATTTAPAQTEAPAEATAAPEEPAAIELTDMTGRKISLSAPAKRIVALTAADCEILYAIHAGDKVIARGEYCNYPEACLALPTVSSGDETNLEAILALSPDAVVMSTMSQTAEQIAALEKAGVAVVVSDADTIGGVYESIEMLGTFTGHSAEAAQLIETMRAGFSALSEKAKARAAAEKPSVYFEVSPLEWGLWVAGTNTFMDEIAGIIGVENAFSDVDGWAEISEEQVLTRNPDVIVTTTMYYGEGPTPVEEVLSRTGWQNLATIQNNRVFNADSDAITRPGPRLLDAAEALFNFVYGG